MSKRHSPRTHQRICAWCHSGISEQRPVFLVRSTDGNILGPFHAGCAERLKLESTRSLAKNGLDGAVRFGTWPTIREETLPE